MSDTLGRITITAPSPSVTFPLRTDFGHGRARKRQVITHQFGNASGKAEQRFYVGPAATRYTFRRPTLSNAERASLRAFWGSQLGPAGVFYYSVPQDDQSFVTKTVAFEDAPLTLDDLSNSICSSGVTFVEIVDPAAAPTYTVNSTDTRFPGTSLASALLDAVQDLVPLVRIRVTEQAVPDIFVADRRLTLSTTVGMTTTTQLYIPRLLRVGEDKGVLMSQSITGESDNVQFTFGNADRAMVQCANDTDLFRARIEFSVFHVGSGIKIDLWAGEIVNWSSDFGPDFSVDASDRISSQTVQSPVRNISRSCWRVYGDASTGCPVVIATDTRDLVHFPSADMATCDRGYDTPNGCLAHTVAILAFPGCIAAPQQVKVMDNSTGSVFGFGRSLITPTSMINDSIWGGTLPEIWHNDDGIAARGLPVTCRIVSARDESDFVIALGIVGRGPIGAFSTPQMVDANGDGIKETFVGSTLDGQPNHGFKRTDRNGNFTNSGFGLRTVAGTDPAGTTDYFSLGRVGTTPTSWREAVGGGSVYEQDYAAGVAFIEIRRTDQKGIQPVAVSSHEMIGMISQGLTAMTWTAPGSRSTLPGCTNPFWVAVNTLLRSFGVDQSTYAVQEGFFDVASAVASAAQADAVVNALIGGGTETQFRFKGSLDSLRPLRDRLTEILNNGMGFFTWSFGKLKVGGRFNATPQTTFNAGNMLFGSLRLDPIRPQFEKLTIDFADTEYMFAKNTVDYTDFDYSQRNGRIQNPRASQLGLLGSATKSQTLRIAVMRTREELGGVGIIEQTNARNASWRTTILALDTEAGQVVQLADPDVPTGAGAFRIQKWTLNRDWSVDITGRTATDSMYDLGQGFVPAVTTEAAKVQPAAIIDSNVPPSPVFSARIALEDPTSTEIYGLSLTSTIDIRTITAGTFTAYYFDASVAAPTITAGITSMGLLVGLSSVAGISAGTFLLIDSEIVLCGTPSGLNVPITRAQLGTTAASHSTVAATILTSKAFGAVFPYDFFSGSTLAAWTLRMYLPGMTVSAVAGYVTNEYGDSAPYDVDVNLVLQKGPLLAPGAPAPTTGQTLIYGPGGYTPGSPAGVTWVRVVPTGALDGANKIFTIPDVPLILFLILNQATQIQGTDFTLSGSTITFTQAPQSDDEIEAIYPH